MLIIDVTGVPAPQGSHRAFVVNGRAVVTQDNKKTKPWRQEVTAAALNVIAELPGFEPYVGPVHVGVTFTMPRPGYHFRSGARSHELKPNAPTFVDKKPDTDKLLRSILDALTAAGVFRDDAQVAGLSSVKRYTDDGRTGALITISPLTAVAAADHSPGQTAATVQEALL